jgi:HD-GYP domain-containing protein (c-di-GMP phosphodiesterase class II)
MSKPNQPEQMRDLVGELLKQFVQDASLTGRRSLGIVGPAVSNPQPPSHCLRSCLKGDSGPIATLGCAWLRNAAAGRLETDCLRDERCPRGFRIAGRPVMLSGGTGVMLAIEESSEAGDAGSEHSVALAKLESLSNALEQVGRVIAENEGLADEVLRSYEQLNLIFDFTQQIASYTDADRIEIALFDRLGEMLSAQAVVVVSPEGECRCYDVSLGTLVRGSEAAGRIDPLRGEIEKLRRARTLSVHSTPTARAVLAPLIRMDDRVDVVAAIRPTGASEFTSGDMLMVESLLTFGGQIISNSEIHERLHRMSFESTRALVAAIDKKDHYTSGHSERVGLLAILIGQRLGVPVEKLQLLEMSALLHDVGKIGIPEAILSKPGKLTRDEFEVIRGHPRMGYEILKPIASFGGVLDGVLFHHENPDGSGYPEGLVGDQIPLYARIIHVVDVFDALTSTRSYRRAFSFEQAREIIRAESGTKLDAETASILLELLPTLREEHADQFSDAVSSGEEVTDAFA